MSTENLDLADLRAKAEAATPGPWKIWGMSVMADPVGDSNLETALPVALTSDSRFEKPRTFNAQYIAAANPQTVLALLDLLAERDATTAGTYAPSDEEVRTAYATYTDSKGVVRVSVGFLANFDRWLAERDRATAERAWNECVAAMIGGWKPANPYAKGVTS